MNIDARSVVLPMKRLNHHTRIHKYSGSAQSAKVVAGKGSYQLQGVLSSRVPASTQLTIDALIEDYLGYMKRWSQTVWKTRTGESIPISKMDDGHLLNTINMLIRKGKVASLHFYSLLPEAYSRGLWTDTEKMKWRLTGVSEPMWRVINYLPPSSVTNTETSGDPDQ